MQNGRSLLHVDCIKYFVLQQGSVIEATLEKFLKYVNQSMKMCGRWTRSGVKKELIDLQMFIQILLLREREKKLQLDKRDVDTNKHTRVVLTNRRRVF